LYVVCLSQAGTWRAQSHTQLIREKKSLTYKHK
jgi:hypothetical protein